MKSDQETEKWQNHITNRRIHSCSIGTELDPNSIDIIMPQSLAKQRFPLLISVWKREKWCSNDLIVL